MTTKKINILHVLPNVNAAGGIEQYVLNICSCLDKNLFQFDVLHHRWNNQFKNSNDLTGDFNLLGCNVYSVSDPSEGIANFLKETEEFFKTHQQYDIVHVHTMGTSARFLYLAKKYNCQHRIFHIHEEKLSDKKSHVLRNSVLVNFSKRFATDFMAVSKVAGESILKRKKFSLVYAGIDWRKYQFDDVLRAEIRKKYRINKNSFVIGSVGRFTKQKNFPFMVHLFLEILKFKPDSYLVFVGDGPEAANLKKLVDKYRINDKVLFLGNLSPINKLYSVFDVFVMSSVYEGLPLVALEAQASGLPCYLSDSITQECNIQKCYYYPLKKDKREIAKSIINADINDRDASVFKDCVFNNRSFAKTLNDVYLSIVGNKQC